ncbi:MAG: hypothetical protein Tsb0020_26570 [Haliangiales bacterium]
MSKRSTPAPETQTTPADSGAAATSAPGDASAERGSGDGDGDNSDDADESPAALHHRIEELTTDIGAVLHANTSTLFMAHSAADAAIRALGPNPFTDDIPDVEDINLALAEPAKQAAQAIKKLLAIAAEPDRPQSFDEHTAEELEHAADTLADDITDIQIPESHSSTLRSIAGRVQDILADVPPRTLPKSVLRQVRQSVHDVERCTALAALLQARAAILQMDYTIRSFREFVTSDLRREEPLEPLRVAQLLESAHRQLADYAQISNVGIRRHHRARGAEVMGIKRELVRAVGNLMHNAIKYSWRRDKTTPAWVDVTVQRRGKRICVEFENWGVPISRQELETGSVFELGYRGKLSVDRGRLGTGIGLTDAHDIIRRHRGTLEIESKPARAWGPDDPTREEYYRQPFLTTVTVCLPEAL